MINLFGSTKPCPSEGDADGRDGGFILVTFGLLLIPIVIFTALAVDLSSWYSRATELQRTADAAALAGVVWMPDYGQASTNARPVLRKNGVVDGADNMTVAMSVGETGITSFKVCVTDTKVTQFFGQVFASPTKMTRCGTAQYNAPLQLGSPLNYFGGNYESLYDYRSGAWPANAIPTVPPLSRFTGSNKSYCRVLTGTTGVGYWYRGNPPSSNSRNWAFIWGTITNVNNCNTPAPVAPDLASFKGGRICRVMSGSTQVGYWDTRGYTSYTAWRYVPDGTLNRSAPICGWGGSADSPIPPSKSPGMWAAVEGYRNSHENGDAYSTNGSEWKEDDPGYWYSVDVGPGVVGPLSIQAWDLAYNCDSGCRTAMGDDQSNGTTPVRLMVYRADTLKYDMSAIKAVPGCDTGWITPGGSATYNLRWAEVCNIGTPSAGSRYYIKVLSNDGTDGMSGGGYNGYALRAVAGAYPSACLDTMPKGDESCYGTGTQPRLSAYGSMEMYNGIPEGVETQFYLANVTPAYAGKTLRIELFDPGDMSPKQTGNGSWVTIIGPNDGSPDGIPIPASACTVESRNYGGSSYSSVALSDGPEPSYNDTCTVETTKDTNNKYNDRWLRFEIDLPSDYGPTGSADWTKCDEDVADPVTTAGSCWWQVKYFTKNNPLSDYTTWSAGIINDPVRLVR